MPHSLLEIRQEIARGLPGPDRERRDAARRARDFYERRNDLYLKARREEDPLDFEDRAKCHRLLTYQAVRALSRHLYNPGPARQLAAPGPVRDFLEGIYESNSINELMAEADRLASLGGAGLIEAHATGRPEKPVKLYLYGADECRVWADPEDPGLPVAICTIQRLPDASLRYDLWTDEVHEVWATDPPASPGAIGGIRGPIASLTPPGHARPRPDLSGPNPYGILPFAAAHDELPISDFWGCGGIGPALARANESIDEKLSDLADAVAKFLVPPILARNVGAKFRFRWLRGLVQHLVPDANAVLNESGQPEVFPVQAQADIAAGWDDLDRFADAVLEDVGCPPGAVKLRQSQSAPSGIAQLVAGLPLRERALQRRGPFSRTERDLARVILRVGSAYAGGEPLALHADAPLALTWPSIPTPLPLPELDQADQWLLDRGLKSKVMVLMDRQGLTRDQALRHLDQVAADRKAAGEPDPKPPADAPSPSEKAEAPRPNADSEGEEPVPSPSEPSPPRDAS